MAKKATIIVDKKKLKEWKGALKAFHATPIGKVVLYGAAAGLAAKPVIGYAGYKVGQRSERKKRKNGK